MFARTVEACAAASCTAPVRQGFPIPLLLAFEHDADDAFALHLLTFLYSFVFSTALLLVSVFLPLFLPLAAPFSIVVSSRFRSRPRSFRSFAASTPTNPIVAARRFFSVPRCFGSSPSTFDVRLSCCALHCVPQHQQQQLRCSAGIPAARAAEQWLVQRPGLLSCLMLLVPSRL